MFDIANTSIDIVILLLRVAVVLLLYFFLWQVLRFVVRDLQYAGQGGAAAAPASPYGQLVVLRSGQSSVAAGKVFPLSPSTIIGRSMESCEIALNDSFLSQQHARLELRGDQWVLEDLGSTNGTFVNDIEVRDPTIVEEGDIIRLGRIELRLVR
ncbi:MAG: FHA domain-containing protein [Chloroflexota bacterium]|nr:MAG: FHA domain-containing protein [Chloroflexota bacterium]